MKNFYSVVLCTLLCLPVFSMSAQAAEPAPVVVIETSLGVIFISLNPQKAPLSVENFLEYVDSGFYNGTIFHRVIKGFMVQGGGFDASMRQKTTRAPIKNEAKNGLPNDRGTIALARTQFVDSATSQFYINTEDNPSLNHAGESRYGYAVFGKVVRGMSVVDAIADVRTQVQGGMRDVPAEPVLITRAYRQAQ